MMKTLIIVEDEARTRQGLARLIEKVDMGCTVIGTAENGYEGLQMITRLEPDIVITDIQMPRMDGLKMIEQAKAIGVECDYVILTGYSEFEYARTGLRLGVTDYLLKPVTISLVKELLAKLTADSGKPAAEETDRNYSQAVQGMVDAVEKNCGMVLSLESFAQKYHMAPEYISNLFAKEVGQSFSNYKKQIRMEKAKELLLTTDMKVYEVACAVGYPDQKYFSRVFKEYTGVSAKQFTLNYHLNAKEAK